MVAFATELARTSETQALVSVIIPVFQGRHIVMGAVRSALAQTHRRLEVFVVDDGSTDGTHDVLASIRDPRVTVLRQANAGTAAARNHALRFARGEYIAFLDSDDRWLPDKIEAEVRALRASAEPIAIAYSSYFAVDDHGHLLNLAPRRTVSGSILDQLLDGDDFLMPSLCLFDRRVFDEIGTFNAGRYHEDHEFILRAARFFPIVATGRRLAVYRQSTSGKCRAILSDFERAKGEELSLLDDMAAVLSAGQIARLRENVMRSLYCRFLMYGFDSSARRVAGDVDMHMLRSTKKGLLAWVSAKSGVNVLLWARHIVQFYYRSVRRGWWARFLRSAGMDLQYG